MMSWSTSLVDQDITEFFSCFFMHMSTRGILQRYLYIYILPHLSSDAAIFSLLTNFSVDCLTFYKAS